MKVKQQQMIFKIDGKFEWKGGPNYFYVNLPAPRYVRYKISKFGDLYELDLIRLSNNGHDLHIGKFYSLEDAKNRAELREARYEVKKATQEGK